MPVKLLVPLVSGTATDPALPAARTLARALAGAVHVVAAPGIADGAAAASLDGMLAAVVRTLKDEGLTATSAVLSGAPAVAIAREAERIGANLIVASVPDTVEPGQAALGALVGAVFGFAARPLVVVRAGHGRMARVDRLLVPVDGSPDAVVPAEVAFGLARLTDARVTLFEVLAPLPPPPRWMLLDGPTSPVVPDLHEAFHAGAQRGLDEIVSHLHRVGMKVDGHVSEAARAAPAQAVADAIGTWADQAGTDMIVVGARASRSGVAQGEGSTADHLVRQAHRPILLVPLPAR